MLFCYHTYYHANIIMFCYTVVIILGYANVIMLPLHDNDI